MKIWEKVSCLEHPNRPAYVRRQNYLIDDKGSNIPICRECFDRLPLGVKTWDIAEWRAYKDPTGKRI